MPQPLYISKKNSPVALPFDRVKEYNVIQQGYQLKVVSQNAGGGESLFAKADAIKAQYESLVQKIEDLTPTILAKAFRGELVEQLPEDGSALELLEEIKRLKEESKGKKKTRKEK